MKKSSGKQGAECEGVLRSVSQRGWGRLLPMPPICCTLNAKELTNYAYTIGKRNCTISITESDVESELYKYISPKHCRISRSKLNDDEHGVFLEDLSSSGTFVNSLKVVKGEKVVISSGDEISFVFPSFKVFLFVDSKDSPPLWMPATLSSKYQVVKHLGAGTWAEVKLIYHKVLGLKLATKKLSKIKIAESAIKNEIRILRGLRHPCIVEMVDSEDSVEDAFIIMEYVPNGNLFAKIRPDKHFSESLSRLILVQLAWAVRYMHDNHVIHRDIKPENILVSEKGEGLVVVKIADFGLAISTDSTTRLDSKRGTLNYMAPEVLSSAGMVEYTSKVDMWALGTVLYACLYGRRPFSSKDNTSVLINKIMKAEYKFPSPGRSPVSEQAKSLIGNLLTLNPAARFDSTQVLNDQWVKDPDVLNQFYTLFGSMAPFDDEVVEPATKIMKLENA